ncbi:hypothetical protein C900_00862 [Fulvivirga imtechensis AK7]|uniref:Nucleotidyl transferase AbiEii toxin, Type IV TA system n=1 Tax=Fulvivirga imtechensis AK7 TaxID=1237149 RepID=L8JV55_9BACT|nr:nucleotidyl transferase AbiEii/AbiGii toxin family protein [Fulvivirga imtechensis]ELR72901.1 hypothetical protein C900_00862 [Fulvivirga imtechensis AK7]
MKNTQINRLATIQVAKALDDLNEQVVYVGGAVVSLYIDDPAADDVRPTKDIDLSFEILSIGELELLREELNKRGFKQTFEDNVICRFRLDDKKVDVMATEEIGWAPANRWFKDGFKNSYTVDVEDVTIRLMPFPYFLASKFDAFKGRGAKDARMSHDFEDIVYLLNYTSDFTEIILSSDAEVRIFLINCFEEILNDKLLQEAIIAHMYYAEREERFNIIIDQIKETIDGLQQTQ